MRSETNIEIAELLSLKLPIDLNPDFFPLRVDLSEVGDKY